MIGGDHASHLCHNPTCINPDHIVVEKKELNEGRKSCKGRVVVLTTIGGKQFRLPPLKQCECPGAKCIPMIEVREAEEVQV